MRMLVTTINVMGKVAELLLPRPVRILHDDGTTIRITFMNE